MALYIMGVWLKRCARPSVQEIDLETGTNHALDDQQAVAPPGRLSLANPSSGRCVAAVAEVAQTVDIEQGLPREEEFGRLSLANPSRGGRDGQQDDTTEHAVTAPPARTCDEPCTFVDREGLCGRHCVRVHGHNSECRCHLHARNRTIGRTADEIAVDHLSDESANDDPVLTLATGTRYAPSFPTVPAFPSLNWLCGCGRVWPWPQANVAVAPHRHSGQARNRAFSVQHTLSARDHTGLRMVVSFEKFRPASL